MWARREEIGHERISVTSSCDFENKQTKQKPTKNLWKPEGGDVETKQYRLIASFQSGETCSYSILHCCTVIPLWLVLSCLQWLSSTAEALP